MPALKNVEGFVDQQRRKFIHRGCLAGNIRSGGGHATDHCARVGAHGFMLPRIHINILLSRNRAEPIGRGGMVKKIGAGAVEKLDRRRRGIESRPKVWRGHAAEGPDNLDWISPRRLLRGEGQSRCQNRQQKPDAALAPRG